MPSLISLRLDSSVEWMEAKGAAAKDDAAKIINNYTRSGGKELVGYIQERISKTLRPNHPFNVGASGAAAQNFSISEHKEGKYFFYIDLVEGTNVRQNTFIRFGFKGTRPGKQIPVAKIKEWVRIKGITLTKPKEHSYAKAGNVYRPQQKKDTAYYFTSKSKTGKKYLRSTNKSVADPAIDAIVRKLSRYGSSRSHWVSLYPKGQGRYDYVGYVLKQETSIRNKMVNIGVGSMEAIISYLLSGKYQGFTQKTIEGY